MSAMNGIQKFGLRMPICTYLKKDLELPLNLSKVGCNKCVWQDKLNVWWHDMSYHNRETKHNEVCAVSTKTSQTGFTQSAHNTGKTQKQTHSLDNHASQTNIKSLRNI
jgi:hypothetical protein